MHTEFVVKNAKKLRKSIVGDFAAPEPFHRIDVQVFHADIGIVLRDTESRLKEPISTAVFRISVDSCDIKSGSRPVITTLLLSAQFLLCRPQFGCVRFKETRRLDVASVAACQESFETEIVPDGITLSGSEIRDFLNTNDAEPKVSARIPLDRHSFNCTDKRTMSYILIVSSRDGDMVVVMELIAGLFQGEGSVFRPFSEMRRAVSAAAVLFLGLEEGFVGFINALYDILDGLRTELVPMRFACSLLHLGQMLL